MARVGPDDGGGIRIDLARAELDLLVRLCEGLATRLRAGGDDAVIDRLAPAASRGDAEADSELRRLLRGDLLDGRAERLVRLATELRGWAPSGGRAGVRAVLDDDAALTLLQGLNDVRLALGAQVDIERIDRAGLAEEDPRALTLQLMDRLAGLQQGLLEVLGP
jgi:hypothetical protein